MTTEPTARPPINPRGPMTWPEWKDAQPGITRVEHVRTGRQGLFMRWPRTPEGRKPGYAVIEWDAIPGMVKNAFTGIPFQPGPSLGRVVAYAFDLKLVHE